MEKLIANNRNKGDKPMQIDLTDAKKIAWGFQRTTGIEWEELFGEACLAYARAIPKYNPKKSSFRTWIYTCMRSHLSLFCSNNQNGKKREPLHDNIAALQPTPSRIDFLSKDAQLVCKIVVESPTKFYQVSPKLARQEIKNQLRTIGWKWRRIFNTFREIKGEQNEN